MAQPEPKHLKTRALICLLLLACDDDARPISELDHGVVDVGRTDIGRDVGRPSDAAPRDAEADARRLDARVPLDAVVPDRGPPDARPVDARLPDRGAGDARVLDATLADRGPAQPDARPLDAALPDAAPLDAAPPDAALPDLGPDAVVDAFVDASLPACEGIVLSPLPESLDGSEVCNHRDDDGDGRVDEGFAYGFLGEPVRITPEPEGLVQGLRLTLSEVGYGVAWIDSALSFMTLDPTGCPTSRIWRVDQNPEGPPFIPGSLDLASAGDRFAAIFTQRRVGAPGTGIGTFVQLFDRGGRPVGRPIDLDRRLSFWGQNAIIPFGEHFAVFAGALHPQRGNRTYSVFVILDRDGRPVQGPSHPFNPAPEDEVALAEVVGLAFDGEGFGLAWEYIWSWFMRWSPDGEVLTPHFRYGDFSNPAGVGWDGTHYLLNDRVENRYSVHYFTPAGQPAPWSPLTFEARFDFGSVRQVLASAQMSLIIAWNEGELFYRLDPAGGIIETQAFPRNDIPLAFSPRLADGSYAALSTTSEDGGMSRSIDFWRFGCR